MSHYAFTRDFLAAHAHAVTLYAKGQRGAESFFSPEDLAFLAANGLTAQHLYDYAEDECNGGEPSPAQALAIELVRRDYFLNVQGAKPSAHVIDEASLPPKSAAVAGIEWLPRLIPKTRAKLRGELPSSLMYCCGGDRRFFKTHDILPAEFLSLVWRHKDDDHAIIDWVLRRSTAARG